MNQPPTPVKGSSPVGAAIPQRKADPRAAVIVDAAELFGDGGSEVRIVHRGQEYRLRITRQGKLILTK
jgi:hemin uptake protein HemP